MMKSIVYLTIFIEFLIFSYACAEHPWMNPNDTPAQRAQALLAQMTQEEKCSMLAGIELTGNNYTGATAAIPRLSIPPLLMNDGPQGFRANDEWGGTTTQWPSCLTVAASWDSDILYRYGQGMGAEFYGKGSNVQLGPGMNTGRIPQGGRLFEYAAGEDPYLGYISVQPIIQGIQSQHVIANAKHYINNDQENNRYSVSASVDERTEVEIYLLPFWGAVQGGVLSVMCSYNLINGVYACESNQTLNTELKQYAGFQYFVMTDWMAAMDTVKSCTGGMDMEMPFGGAYSVDAINREIAGGTITQQQVDDHVYRILLAMFTVGVFDIPQPTGSLSKNVTSDAHNQLTREIAAKSSVLLQNKNNVLPLSKNINKLGVFGWLGDSGTLTGGGGSGGVTPPYTISPLVGINNVLQEGRTFQCSYEPNVDYLQGAPSAQATSVEDCCAQCEKRAACNCFTFVDDSKTCYFKISDSGRRNSSGLTSGSVVGKANLTYCNGDVTLCTQLAEEVDAAVCIMGTFSAEGSDRPNLALPDDQTSLCALVAQHNKNTIAVIIAPGPVITNTWDTNVAAIIMMFYPGQEEGNALADILFNNVNPSARLPVTIPNIDNEQQMTPEQYPGVNNVATYSEKLNIGYRWYASKGVKPRFPFGHGLSYTTFDYSNLVINGRNISADITNSGKYAGAEVVQLYLGFPASAGEPPYILKGFKKINLNANQKSTVTFNPTDMDLSIWDANAHKWQLVTGQFTVNIGASSADFRLKGTLTV